MSDTAFSATDCRQTLLNWGFPVATYLQDNLTLNETYYVSYLKDSLRQKNGFLGEMEIPTKLQELINQPGNCVFKLYSLFMGFGHERVLKNFYWLLKTLNFPVERVFIGEQKTHLSMFTEGLIRAGINAYSEVSTREAIEQKMLTVDAFSNIKSTKDIYRYLLDNTLKAVAGKWSLSAKDYHDILMGSSADASAQDVREQAVTLAAIFGADLLKLIQAGGPNCYHLFFHPLIMMVVAELLNPNPVQLNKLKANPRLAKWALGRLSHAKKLLTKGVDITKLKYGAIGTDSVLEHQWKQPKIPLFVETQRGLKEMTDFWGELAAEEIVVTNGFPSPMAMFETAKISKQRSHQLQTGKIPTLILTASAVATVQLDSFRQIIQDCAGLLAQNQLRIIVQTGCGSLGKIVYDQLSHDIEGLAKINQNILLHLGANADSAIDLFEVLAWGEMPLILGVKGSEMCRMAVALNMPLIPTGAIGRHEFFNLYYLLLQGAPVFLLPGLRKNLEENLPQLLNTDELSVIKPLIANASCPNLPSAIIKAREYILQGTIVPTNWQASLEILSSMCP